MTAPILADVASATLARHLLSKFSKGDVWRAMVTPLDSMIGSGFLVARKIRYNISVAEPQ